MIEIGTTHTLRHDGMQWILTHHPGGRKFGHIKGKRTGVKGTNTYYGRIERAFDRILDDHIAGAESLEDMKRRVGEARLVVGTAAQQVFSVLYPSGYIIDAVTAREEK